MISEIYEMLTSRADFFWELTLEHLGISLLSILIAGILGLILGIAISEYKKTSGLVLGVVNFIYTIPSISLLGFLIPFSGIGNVTAIIALTIYALLPMVRSVHTGITTIDPAIIEASEGMGSTKMQTLLKVQLPLALPVIVSGIRNMVVMTIALAGIASFIGAGGLGVAIYRGITTNNMAMTITGSLLIALMAFVLDFLIGVVEKTVDYKSVRKNKTKQFAAAVAIILCIVFGFSFMLRNTNKDTITIASKPMTEQYIMAEMLKMAIEKDARLDVELVQGVGGGTSNIQPGMKKGEFDIYPEYTGTAWNTVLKKKGLYDESMFKKLEKEYKEKYDFNWVGMYGFNNTYGLAVKKEIADKYNIKTYSDLAKHSSELRFGAEYDFYEREDGYDALCKEYGYSFKKSVDLDIGLKYEAINSGKIDVMNIFTTDGQLSASDIVVLKDDKNFYPSYMCGNVVRAEIIEKYPEIKGILEKFNNTITDADMAKMNYEVEEEGKEPKDVAEEFLKKKGII